MGKVLLLALLAVIGVILSKKKEEQAPTLPFLPLPSDPSPKILPRGPAQSGGGIGSVEVAQPSATLGLATVSKSRGEVLNISGACTLSTKDSNGLAISWMYSLEWWLEQPETSAVVLGGTLPLGSQPNGVFPFKFSLPIDASVAAGTWDVMVKLLGSTSTPDGKPTGIFQAALATAKLEGGLRVTVPAFPPPLFPNGSWVSFQGGIKFVAGSTRHPNGFWEYTLWQFPLEGFLLGSIVAIPSPACRPVPVGSGDAAPVFMETNLKVGDWVQVPSGHRGVILGIFGSPLVPWGHAADVAIQFPVTAPEGNLSPGFSPAWVQSVSCP